MRVGPFEYGSLVGTVDKFTVGNIKADGVAVVEADGFNVDGIDGVIEELDFVGAILTEIDD